MPNQNAANSRHHDSNYVTRGQYIELYTAQAQETQQLRQLLLQLHELLP